MAVVPNNPSVIVAEESAVHLVQDSVTALYCICNIGIQVKCSAVSCCSVHYLTLQCSTVQYSAVQYSAMKCSLVQFNKVSADW